MSTINAEIDLPALVALLPKEAVIVVSRHMIGNANGPGLGSQHNPTNRYDLTMWQTNPRDALELESGRRNGIVAKGLEPIARARVLVDTDGVPRDTFGDTSWWAMKASAHYTVFARAES